MINDDIKKVFLEALIKASDDKELSKAKYQHYDVENLEQLKENIQKGSIDINQMKMDYGLWNFESEDNITTASYLFDSALAEVLKEELLTNDKQLGTLRDYAGKHFKFTDESTVASTILNSAKKLLQGLQTNLIDFNSAPLISFDTEIKETNNGERVFTPTESELQDVPSSPVSKPDTTIEPIDKNTLSETSSDSDVLHGVSLLEALDEEEFITSSNLPVEPKPNDKMDEEVLTSSDEVQEQKPLEEIDEEELTSSDEVQESSPVKRDNKAQNNSFFSGNNFGFFATAATVAAVAVIGACAVMKNRQ
jgi:hypothetical protein